MSALTTRGELINDALRALYVYGPEIASIGGMIRDDTEGAVDMGDDELEERGARLRALTTQALLTLTKVVGVAERLQTISETTEPEGHAVPS